MHEREEEMQLEQEVMVRNGVGKEPNNKNWLCLVC